ncbi:hypothetical protein DFH07DRAFT_812280 [Mycena maculata]|uniref:Uncharacterized protein n=1 Tax=Mycena maculata TaxID=230809 RepID=A0AAD7NJN0_9AGAR|nr:hypothetical protein DFH07DRAFT_812280 [Mycena maculata]
MAQILVTSRARTSACKRSHTSPYHARTLDAVERPPRILPHPQLGAGAGGIPSPFLYSTPANQICRRAPLRNRRCRTRYAAESTCSHGLPIHLVDRSVTLRTDHASIRHRSHSRPVCTLYARLPAVQAPPRQRRNSRVALLLQSGRGRRQAEALEGLDWTSEEKHRCVSPPQAMSFVSRTDTRTRNPRSAAFVRHRIPSQMFVPDARSSFPSAPFASIT